MKWIYRLFTVLLLVAALGIPFFIDNQQGEPMLSLPTKDDLVPAIVEKNIPKLPNTTTVYKWQDEHGVWHYGDAPPAKEKTVTTMQLDNRTNVIQSLKPEKKDEGSSNPALQMTPSDTDFLSVERAANVLKDAKLAAQAMEERNKHLQAVLGETEAK